MKAGRFAHSAERLNHLIDIRLKRQEILHRSTPPRLWAILDEAALHRQVGGPDVMSVQLRHLCEVSESDAVTLQVLPFPGGEHRGMTGAFKILYVGEREDFQVVVDDSLTQISYREEDHEIRACADAFDHLRASALSTGDSRVLIEGLMSQS